MCRGKQTIVILYVDTEFRVGNATIPSSELRANVRLFFLRKTDSYQRYLFISPD